MAGERPARRVRTRQPSLRARVADLYRGTDPLTVRFRYGLFAFDLATVTYFVAVSFIAESGIWAVDLGIGFVMLLDVAARLWIAPRPIRHLLLPSTIADLVVLASLIFPASKAWPSCASCGRTASPFRTRCWAS